jgi:hypothetical protein
MNKPFTKHACKPMNDTAMLAIRDNTSEQQPLLRAVAERYGVTLAQLTHFQALPQDKQNFGLIHNDLQANNLRF